MFKNLFSLFVCVVLFVCMFTDAATAARTGEFETHDVEFQAFVPNSVVEPIEIILTHVKDKYKLHYYLYSRNNYFSNDPVALGEYSVEVMVSGYEESEFNYEYDKILKVEPSSSAIRFTIIADQALAEGDYSGEPSIFSGNELTNNVESNDLTENEKTNDVKSKSSGKGSNEKASQDSKEGKSAKSPYSLLVSFGFSLLLVIIAAFVLWRLKNR